MRAGPMTPALPLIVLAAAMVQRPFPDERLLLDRRLETLRRILPDGPSPTTDAAVVKEMADSSKLVEVLVQTRAPLETGARGHVPIELSALGRFEDVDRFFRQLALSPRLIDVESLVITPADPDRVRFQTVVALPYRPTRAPLPPPPEGARALAQQTPRPQVEAFLKDQSLAVAKSEAIAELRRSKRNPRLFLSELAGVVRDRPVVFTRASLGDEFLVSGLTVGEANMRSLETRLERGFFRVSEVLVARQGACHRFEVRGRSPVVGLDAEIPLPNEDPFDQEETACRVDRDAGRATLVRNTGPRVPAKGSLHLRLRDVDLADVFQVLHLLTDQAFLVDEDVHGRVSLDLAGVDGDQVVAALEKTGIALSAPGRFRRVATSRPRELPAPSAAGDVPKVTLALKRATVRDVLAVMAEAHPPLAAMAPAGPLGRISLWAREVPATDARAVVLQAAGLEERVVEEGRLLERPGGNAETLAPLAGASVSRRLVMRPQELAVEEFVLAGIALSAEKRIALAYSPTGALYAFGPGDRLANGVVEAVESTDVLLNTEEGPLRLVLPDLPR
jgi:hypothetical protein